MTTKRQAERALDTYEATLSAIPGVVGLGIVKTATKNPPIRGCQAVAVYMSNLANEHLVPTSLAIQVGRKGATISVPTMVIEQGEVSLEH